MTSNYSLCSNNFLIGLIFFLSLGFNSQAAKVENKPVTISSPNGKVKMTITHKNGKPFYAVEFNKAPVVETSPLGLIVNGKDITEGTFSGAVNRYKVNETYPYRGVHNLAVNKCNGATLLYLSFVLEARVFDDGIAFRYLQGTNDTRNSVISKETTGFIIPAGSTIWSQNNVKYYEARYTKKRIEEFKEGELAGPPVTIVLPNNAGYAAITEGGLTNFAGMSLIVSGSRSFQANLAGDSKQDGRVESPWRIVQVAKDLNTLVNCDIVANVSPAYDKTLFPNGYDTEWIKPGRSVWSWLAGRGPVSLQNMKRFTDLAASLGFEYNLVDEGWSNWRDGTRDCWAMMKELVDYSAAKGVKIWVWKAYPNRGGIPGIKEEQQRKDFFKKCKDIGVVGLKVDFFDNEAQEIVKFYQVALRDAAEYHLMMDFHGANKPTGETRTWPNEMTREAIKGMESRPPWAPSNVVFPFTRYLAGHADFTPIHFGDRLGEITWAHHVASMVVFTSPFLCIGADPQSILDNPAKELIQSIPSVWDETVVLPQSKIGDLVLYARRKGNNWYIAAMNGIHESRTLTVNLSSFMKKGKYSVHAIKDDAQKQASGIVEKVSVSTSAPFTIILNPEGGYAARLQKQ